MKTGRVTFVRHYSYSYSLWESLDLTLTIRNKNSDCETIVQLYKQACEGGGGDLNIGRERKSEQHS